MASLALLRIARNDGVLLYGMGQPVCGCCTMLWTAPAMAAMALNGSVVSGAESENSVRYSIASFRALRDWFTAVTAGPRLLLSTEGLSRTRVN